jgi:hypothetical protein
MVAILAWGQLGGPRGWSVSWTVLTVIVALLWLAKTIYGD